MKASDLYPVNALQSTPTIHPDLKNSTNDSDSDNYDVGFPAPILSDHSDLNSVEYESDHSNQSDHSDEESSNNSESDGLSFITNPIDSDNQISFKPDGISADTTEPPVQPRRSARTRRPNRYLNSGDFDLRRESEVEEESD